MQDLGDRMMAESSAKLDKFSVSRGNEGRRTGPTTYVGGPIWDLLVGAITELATRLAIVLRSRKTQTLVIRNKAIVDQFHFPALLTIPSIFLFLSVFFYLVFFLLFTKHPFHTPNIIAKAENIVFLCFDIATLLLGFCFGFLGEKEWVLVRKLSFLVYCFDLFIFCLPTSCLFIFCFFVLFFCGFWFWSLEMNGRCNTSPCESGWDY